MCMAINGITCVNGRDISLQKRAICWTAAGTPAKAIRHMWRLQLPSTRATSKQMHRMRSDTDYKSLNVMFLITSLESREWGSFGKLGALYRALYDRIASTLLKTFYPNQMVPDTLQKGHLTRVTSSKRCDAQAASSTINLQGVSWYKESWHS